MTSDPITQLLHRLLLMEPTDAELCLESELEHARMSGIIDGQTLAVEALGRGIASADANGSQDGNRDEDGGDQDAPESPPSTPQARRLSRGELVQTAKGAVFRGLGMRN